MPHQNGPDDDAPQPNAGAELQRLVDRAAQRQFDQEAGRKIHHRLRQRDPHHGALDPAIKSVADDVARIAVIGHRAVQIGIFDKQPADIGPEQIDQRAVRIGPIVGAVMVQAMGRHPARRRILQRSRPR